MGDAGDIIHTWCWLVDGGVYCLPRKWMVYKGKILLRWMVYNPYAPWCWYIDLHYMTGWFCEGANVGKYTSTMVRIWVMGWYLLGGFFILLYWWKMDVANFVGRIECSPYSIRVNEFDMDILLHQPTMIWVGLKIGYSKSHCVDVSSSHADGKFKV